MKTSPEDVHVLLVGGGSIICADKLAGVAKVTCPPFYSVANAVGAAMAKGLLDILMHIPIAHYLVVAGDVDVIEIMEGRQIADVIDTMKERAIENAIQSGADKGTTVLRCTHNCVIC